MNPYPNRDRSRITNLAEKAEKLVGSTGDAITLHGKDGKGSVSASSTRRQIQSDAGREGSLA